MKFLPISPQKVCQQRSQKITKRLKWTWTLFECFAFVESTTSCECAGWNELQQINLFRLLFLYKSCPLCVFNQNMYNYHIDWTYWVRIKTRKLRKSSIKSLLKELNSDIKSKNNPEWECKSRCVCGQFCASSKSFYWALLL